jgi:hypothetical protein
LGESNGKLTATDNLHLRHHVVSKASAQPVIGQLRDMRCAAESVTLSDFLNGNDGSLLCVVCLVPANLRAPVLVTDASLVQAELWLWDAAADWREWLTTGDIISIRGARRRGSAALSVASRDRLLLAHRLTPQPAASASVGTTGPPGPLTLAHGGTGAGAGQATFTAEQLLRLIHFARARFTPRYALAKRHGGSGVVWFGLVVRTAG